LRQGIAALKAGRKAEARHLLMQVVEQDERNEMAWLWLSGAVDTDEDRHICLDNVLAINPNNAAAKRGLERLLASTNALSPKPGAEPTTIPPEQPAQPPADAPAEPAATPREQPIQAPAETSAPDVTRHEEHEEVPRHHKATGKRTGLMIGLGAVGAVLVFIAIAVVWRAINNGLLQLGPAMPIAADTTLLPSTTDATSTPVPSLTQTPTWTPTPTATPTPAAPPASASLGDTWSRPTDGMVMVYVPTGEFEMGSDDDEVDYALQLCSEYYDDCEREEFEDEQPVHTVALDGFWIDRTEVTNIQYRRCVGAGACDLPAESDPEDRDSYYGDSAYADYPVIDVSWRQATDYCAWAWAGARLPTEAEWEYAARGPEGRRFPWGDEFDGTRLNYCDVNCGSEWADWADEMVDDGYASIAPVGSYPSGASWCGALDMAGNACEWVADWYSSSYYGSSPPQNPTGPSYGWYRGLRGGSFFYVPPAVRSAYRHWAAPDDTLFYWGFRCALVSE